jgi:hypothetical protein
LGIGIGLSVTFSVLLSISRGRSTKSGIAGAVSEAWDDEIGEQQANRTRGEPWDGDDWSGKPQTVKAPDVDAEFRVITPPMRSLEDID